MIVIYQQLNTKELPWILLDTKTHLRTGWKNSLQEVIYCFNNVLKFKFSNIKKLEKNWLNQGWMIIKYKVPDTDIEQYMKNYYPELFL